MTTPTMESLDDDIIVAPTTTSRNDTAKDGGGTMTRIVEWVDPVLGLDLAWYGPNSPIRYVYDTYIKPGNDPASDHVHDVRDGTVAIYKILSDMAHMDANDTTALVSFIHDVGLGREPKTGPLDVAELVERATKIASEATTSGSATDPWDKWAHWDRVLDVPWFAAMSRLLCPQEADPYAVLNAIPGIEAWLRPVCLAGSSLGNLHPLAFPEACRRGLDAFVGAALTVYKRVYPHPTSEYHICRGFDEAASLGHVAVVDRLLRPDALALCRDGSPLRYGNDAIKSAVLYNRVAVVERLVRPDVIALGMDPAGNENVLIVWAALRGFLTIVDRLMQPDLVALGVDPSVDDSVALAHASRNGHLDVVDRLLQDRRVRTSAQDYRALQWAAENGHDAVVARLLQDNRIDHLRASYVVHAAVPPSVRLTCPVNDE